MRGAIRRRVSRGRRRLSKGFHHSVRGSCAGMTGGERSAECLAVREPSEGEKLNFLFKKTRRNLEGDMPALGAGGREEETGGEPGPMRAGH